MVSKKNDVSLWTWGHLSRELGVPQSLIRANVVSPLGWLFSIKRLETAAVSLKHMGCLWCCRRGGCLDITEARFSCVCITKLSLALLC